MGGAIQAFKGDGTRTPSRRKQLKEACGRKPLLRKNRGEYDKCVAKFNASKNSGIETKELIDNTSKYDDTPPTEPSKDNKKIIIIGVVVAAVLVTAFVGYKKGWFAKKAV